MASFVEGDQSGGAGNWFEQNRPSPTGLVNPGQPIPGYDYPTGASTPTGASGVMAPRLSAEDQRLLQDPAFKQKYDAWVMAQGPGAADWATPTTYQQQTGAGGAVPGGGAPTTTTPYGQPGPGYLPYPGGSPPTGGGGAPKTYAEAQAAFNQLFPGETLTPQMLQEHKAELEALGFQLRPNAQGVVGKIQWGNEPIVDVIQGAGSGLNKKQWLTGAPIPGGGGGALGGLAGGYQGGFGGMVAPWTEQFKARDPNEIMQDPAYQFQLKEGLRGVTSGAAAKGTLLTGGTLKALEGYGQGLASTYNDKYYGRDVGEYGMRKENFYQNQDRPFDKFFSTAQLGKPSPA